MPANSRLLALTPFSAFQEIHSGCCTVAAHDQSLQHGVGDGSDVQLPQLPGRRVQELAEDGVGVPHVGGGESGGDHAQRAQRAALHNSQLDGGAAPKHLHPTRVRSQALARPHDPARRQHALQQLPDSPEPGGRLAEGVGGVGFSPNELDGVIAPGTRAALTSFQWANGLPEIPNAQTIDYVGSGTIQAIAAQLGEGVFCPPLE
jgi:hypothetical protein